MFVRHIITSMSIAHDLSSDQWFNHNEVTSSSLICSILFSIQLEVITDPSTNLTILSSLFESEDEPHEPSAKRSSADLRLIIPDVHVREQQLTRRQLGDLDFFGQIRSLPPASSSSTEDLGIRLVKAMTTREIIDQMYENFLWK